MPIFAVLVRPRLWQSAFWTDGRIALAAQVEKPAWQEARNLSQICEMLLKIGVDEYEKDGHKYLQKVLIPSRGEDQH